MFRHIIRKNRCCFSMHSNERIGDFQIKLKFYLSSAAHQSATFELEGAF